MRQLKIHSESFRYLEKSFKEWLDILGYAPQTVYGMPTKLREFFHYLEQQDITQITQVEVEDFRSYYEQLRYRKNYRRGGGLSNRYLNKQLQMLHKFADYLRQSGRKVIPVLNIPQEKLERESVNYLTEEEIKALYKATEGYNEGTILEPFNARDRAMLSIYYSCGLRRNEGFHLDLNDVDFDRRVVHVRKGKNYKERLVPFNKKNSEYLQEWVYDWRPVVVRDKRESAFFISQRGARMQSQSMALRLKLLQQRSEYPTLQEKDLHLHLLRHSIATHLLQAGMSLENISRFLGHSSLESTQVYTHLIEESEA